MAPMLRATRICSSFQPLTEGKTAICLSVMPAVLSAAICWDERVSFLCASSAFALVTLGVAIIPSYFSLARRSSRNEPNPVLALRVGDTYHFTRIGNDTNGCITYFVIAVIFIYFKQD